MSILNWSEHLAIDDGVMDTTHREFVAYLNRMGSLEGEELLALLDEFIAHTESHFGQELRWMEALEFPPTSCHVDEHNSVLEICREVRKRVENGDTGFGEILARAVAQWFEKHVASMDTVLSMYMKEHGYAPTRH